MNVLMINGSPHKEGNTWLSLKEMEKIFKENGIESEIVHVGNQAIRGCIACRSCAKNGKCVFDDCVNELAPKFENVMGWLLQVLCIMLRPTEQWFLFWIDCFLVHHLIKR